MGRKSSWFCRIPQGPSCQQHSTVGRAGETHEIPPDTPGGIVKIFQHGRMDLFRGGIRTARAQAVNRGTV